jgi:hypothetical protein
MRGIRSSARPLRMDPPMPGREQTSLPASPWLRLSRVPRIPSVQDLHKLIRPILVIIPALYRVSEGVTRVRIPGVAWM